MQLFSYLNEVAPHVLGMFITEYNRSGCTIPIAAYPDSAPRGLILEWLEEYMDIVLSDIITRDLFSGTDGDRLINEFIILEKEFEIK